MSIGEREGFKNGKAEERDSSLWNSYKKFPGASKVLRTKRTHFQRKIEGGDDDMNSVGHAGCLE